MKVQLCVQRDEVPFLNAIASSPRDEDLRLVYADWLEENEEPVRAEFLRLQAAGRNVARQKALAQRFEPGWLGLLNIGLDPGDEVAIIGGDFAGIYATVEKVDLRQGNAAIAPQIFYRPIAVPEVSLGQLLRTKAHRIH